MCNLSRLKTSRHSEGVDPLGADLWMCQVHLSSLRNILLWW
jgi:hypothetical protein